MTFYEILDCIFRYVLIIATIIFFTMITIGGVLINLDIDVKDPRKRDEENGYEHQNSDDHKSSEEQS
mgnify:CR=1 FL=1